MWISSGFSLLLFVIVIALISVVFWRERKHRAEAEEQSEKTMKKMDDIEKVNALVASDLQAVDRLKQMTDFIVDDMKSVHVRLLKNKKMAIHKKTSFWLSVLGQMKGRLREIVQLLASPKVGEMKE